MLVRKEFQESPRYLLTQSARSPDFYCNKNLGNAHSALADTEATLEILSAQAFKYGKGEDDIKILGSFNYKNNVEFFDGEKKFRWWNGKLYMMFGKYAKQYSLQEI